MARPKKKATTVDEAQKQTPIASAEVPAERTYSEAEVADLVKRAVAEALAAQQPMRVYTSPKDEMVTILYMDDCSKDNVLELPNYGSLTPGAIMQVPKSEFAGPFMSLFARKLIRKRKLLILDGLTEDERVRWGVNYNKGEVLDMQTFNRMLDLPTDEIVKIFDSLCIEHKKFIVTVFMDAYFPQNGGMHDNRISLEKAEALNRASRKDDPNGMFQKIVDAALKERGKN